MEQEKEGGDVREERLREERPANRLLRITPTGLLKLCLMLILLPITLRLIANRHGDDHSPTTVTELYTPLSPPLGSLLPSIKQPMEHVFTNDGEMSTHKQRALVLFTLAVAVTILVQITKTLLKLGGFVMALLIIGAVLEGLWLIFMAYVWPKIETGVLPKVKEKIPAMPKMPPMPKMPAINIPFLKKKNAD